MDLLYGRHCRSCITLEIIDVEAFILSVEHFATGNIYYFSKKNSVKLIYEDNQSDSTRH